MIRWTYAYLDRPAARLGAALDFWGAVTAAEPSAPRGDHGEFRTFVPPGTDPAVKIQAVGDGGGAHLDLMVDDLRAFAAHTEACGGALEADHGDWIVLRSPSGTPFRAGPYAGEVRRPLPIGPAASRETVDQVCVDVGPSAFDAETAFWTALTGWDGHPSESPEFWALDQPAGLPVRILVQRLGEERPSGAHVDLACADADVSRRRHEGLGAVTVAEFPGWIVMRDPAGVAYCLTRRPPAEVKGAA